MLRGANADHAGEDRAALECLLCAGQQPDPPAFEQLHEARMVSDAAR